jgi:hypothetical protein
MGNQLDAFLALYSRETRENVLCLRKLLLEVFPQAVELIDPKSGIIAYSFKTKGNSGLVFAIATHMKHVNLMFSKGAQLADPTKLLAGTGKQARHVKIKSEAETQNLALRQLLEDALKLDYTE